MKLEFVGAAHTVTGSQTAVYHGGVRVLVDCGMFHGPKPIRMHNWMPIPGVHNTDSLILTHAHVDHSGLIPKFVREGYEGPIYCSQATFDLCRIMLIDSAHLQEEDAKYANRSGHSHHKPALPLYTLEDAHRSLKLFRPVDQGVWHGLSDNLSFRLSRSGHILGSSFVELGRAHGNGHASILFSGDLGSGRSPILKPPVTGLEADVVVLESTYGDRIHPRTDVQEQFAKVVNRVCGRGGVLVIPAFAVGRTQEVLFHLQELERKKEIPEFPVYVDSPMANQATEVYLKHPEEHQLVAEGEDLREPICPKCYKAILSVDESKKLNELDGPMIVVSAAGMLSGGRVLHHLKSRLPDPKNAVLFVGYQAVETKGRLLQDGIESIRLHHQEIPVRAEVLTIEGMSAHADQKGLVEWVRHLRKPPKRIFINHGDGMAPEVLAEILRKEFEVKVDIPGLGEEFEL